jgi:serine/threonine protein kinase
MTKDRDAADPIPRDEDFRELVVSARVYYRNDKQIDWAEWQHLTNEANEHGLTDDDALRAVRKAMGNNAWSPPLAPAAASPSGNDSLAAISLRSGDQASTTQGRLKKGVLINDTYRLEEEVGSGGMGVVWRAVHTKLGTVAAIKFLKGTVGEDCAARFLREARTTAKIESPHLARVYDCAQLQTGELFIVMEYFDGIGLDDLLHREGPLPVKRAVDYILQACIGLAAAHRREIVHRDIKPANLFLAKDENGEEQIKIVDFGLSRLAQPEDGEGLTQDQTFLGTPDYAPPEQYGAAMNAREPADIWAMGATLYALIAGQSPFPKNPDLGGMVQISELLDRVMKAPHPPLSSKRKDVPEDLDKVIAKCLEKKPEDRYPTVADFALDLARFGSDTAQSLADQVLGALSTPSPRTSSPDSKKFVLPAHRVTVLAPKESAPAAAPAKPPDRTMLFVLVAAVALLAALYFVLRPG